jgi:NDP-sugar pyrophosphorylase family protein
VVSTIVSYASPLAFQLITVRDSILRPPAPQHIFICNIDVCCSFPFGEMLELHSKHRGVGTILGVNVSQLYLPVTQI